MKKKYPKCKVCGKPVYSGFKMHAECWKELYGVETEQKEVENV